MATVSKWNAVAKVGKLEFGGFIAWLAWLGLHLIYLVGFKTKIATLLSWTVTFLGRNRGQLTITDDRQRLAVRVAPDATGTATFTYAVSDGTAENGLMSGSATVTR